MDITVSGGEGTNVTALIEESVATLLENSTNFDDPLMIDGIVDVRLKDDSNSVNALISGGTAAPGSPITTTVVTISAAAAIALVAWPFMRSCRKRGYEDLDDKDDEAQSYANTAPVTVAGGSNGAI